MSRNFRVRARIESNRLRELHCIDGTIRKEPRDDDGARGEARGFFRLTLVVVYESPMKVFYGLKPTPISEMMAQGIGACLLTSSFATLWVANAQIK